MRKSLKNIQKVIQKFNVKPTSEMRSKVLDDALELQINRNQRRTSGTEIGRIIMKSNITKFAAAAVIIIAVFIGITTFNGTPVYAIEQTAEALSNFKTVYFHGTMLTGLNNKVPFEAWARPNQKRTGSGDCKFVVEKVMTVLSRESENISYRYDVNKNLVTIEMGITGSINPWIDENYIMSLKDLASKFTQEYGKDPQTAKECVFIKAEFPQFNVNGQSIWFQIDLETKLPVRAKVWENLNFSGEPSYDVSVIKYNPQIGEETFEFEIPAGANVVDLRKHSSAILTDPNYGISAEGLPKTEACKAIVQEYWLAVIDQQWEVARKLRSIPLELWEDWKKSQYDTNMPIEIVEVKEPYHDNDHMTTPVLIKLSDGSIKQSKLMVKFRTIDNVNSCIIIGNYGPQELNRID